MGSANTLWKAFISPLLGSEMHRPVGHVETFRRPHRHGLHGPRHDTCERIHLGDTVQSSKRERQATNRKKKKKTPCWGPSNRALNDSSATAATLTGST